MKLTITRHGRTEENDAGILQGHLPGTLSALGQEQAKKVALRLQEEKFDMVFSSDLLRAVDTTNTIMKYHPGVPVEFTDELREQNLGIFQGKKKYDENGATLIQKSDGIDPEDGESLDKMFYRAQYFLQKLYKNYMTQSILLVGHDGINKALIASATGLDSSAIYEMEGQKNTSVNILNIEENGKGTLVISNCTLHLE